LNVESTANNDLPSKFTVKEVQDVVKKLSKNKAPGPNRVTNEMIREGGISVVKWMQNMFNNIVVQGTLPSEWKKVTIKSIYKNKGLKCDLKNQRGIFLTQTISKIFEKLVLSRIQPDLETNMSDFQNGARPQRGTADSLFIIRALINYYKYYNVPITIVFYDLEKCFDRLWLKDCMIDLFESGVKNKLWSIIYELNETCEICVKTPIGVSKGFTAKQIVKQGTVLAANICANSVDKLNNESRSGGIGAIVGNVNVPNLAFQDDIAQVNISTKTAEKQLMITESFQRAKKMKFNELKTQTMTIQNGQKNPPKLELNGTVIPKCSKYKYLGDIFNDKNSYSDLIDERVKIAKNATNEICAMIENEYMSASGVEIGIKLFKAVFIPRIFHNCETWSNIDQASLKRLDTVMLSALKRILHLPKSSVNFGVLSEVGILTAKLFVYQNKLLFLHRIVHSTNKALTDIFQWELETNCVRSWTYEVRQICEILDIQFELQDIEMVTKNQWKNEVSTKIHEYFVELIQAKKSTKTEFIKNCEMKRYLTELTATKARQCIRLRILSINSAKYQRSSYQSDTCILCDSNVEDLKHIITCKRNAYCVGEQIANELINDIYSEESNSIEKAVDTIMTITNERDRLMNSV